MNLPGKLEKKIGIIGAGPAGLTAAETLKDKGYTNVTILEKENSAGGKCSSFEYEGRSYELGAGVIAGNHHTVLNLARKNGVKIAPVDFAREIIFMDTKTGKPIKRNKSLSEKILLFRQVFGTYRKMALRYRKMAEPGLNNVDPELCVPFSKWISNHKIPLVSEELAHFFTGWGYGYFDEIPAAYVLKYYSWELLKSFIKKSIYNFPDGIQKLWTTVAKNHHVRYSTSVKKIERNASIQVTVEQGGTREILEFDTLILSCPLDEALDFLDASDIERDLFSKILYCDYRVYACFLKGFPANDGYLPAHYSSTESGKPVFWYQRYPDSNLYTFYVLGDWKISDEQVLKNIEHVVQMSGATIERFYTSVHWKYFPHVTTEEMEKGYFDTLENSQGEKNTYFIGELLNFSMVELTSAYAKKLVERFF